MTRQSPVVHFEMPYRDADRAAKFYADVFGWKPTRYGQEMGNYVVVETTDTKDGRPTTPGAINGGLFPFRSDWPGQHPSVVIAVEDIRAAMAAIADAGGEVLGEPMEIPGVGLYAGFNDTEGNRISILQPGGTM